MLATAILLVAAVRAVPQASLVQASFHVSGVVLREGTKVPVPRCHLVMRPEGQPSNRRLAVQGASEQTAETDAQGRFAFDLRSEGTWQLSASAVGFRTQLYNEHEEFSSAVVVRADLPLPELIFLLEPDSTVFGVVRDEAGEAVRNAVLMLQLVPAAHTAGGRRQQATTDDQGHFEISGVPPGNYKLSVQATPWYATGANHGVAETHQTGTADPSLDVVYPVTWYPGVLESETAGEIKLHGGEAAHADFTLLPVPAAHLRVAGTSGGFRGPVAVPTIERVEDGTPTGIAMSVSTAGAQMESGGLSPGLYRVSSSQPDGRSVTAFVHVAAGASISLSEIDAMGTTDVTCRFAGEEKPGRSQVVLTDVSTGAVFSSSSRGFSLRRRASPSLETGDAAENERRIAAPAGRYYVSLTGDPDVYLMSVSLQDKPVAGRVLVLPGGSVRLTLHVGHGRAFLTGRALLSGRWLAGAMIMLVPTTFGQPGSSDLLRRDQSNTDGSYELRSIIPGDYILLAIDRGWSTNWHDPATLDHYLLHGIPLSLQPRSAPLQDVQAQLP